jgi:beta-lactam-binding protein with PASTA domain
VLANAGFTNVDAVPTVTTRADLAGKVINQDPAAGTPRDPAAKVTIFIGDYDEPVTTPPPTTSPGP